jgi:hypothetical protein
MTPGTSAGPIRWPIIVAGFLAAVWLGLVAIYLLFLASGQPVQWFRLPPNELGDFLASVAAPLAFVWLVATVWLQSDELRLQRLEISKSVGQLEEQSKQLSHQTAQLQLQTQQMTREHCDHRLQAELDSISARILRLAERARVFRLNREWQPGLNYYVFGSSLAQSDDRLEPNEIYFRAESGTIKFNKLLEPSTQGLFKKDDFANELADIKYRLNACCTEATTDAAPQTAGRIWAQKISSLRDSLERSIDLIANCQKYSPGKSDSIGGAGT